MKVAIRLLRSDLRNSSLKGEVDYLIQELSLSPEQIDLIIDLQIIGDSESNFRDLTQRLPYIDQWKKLIALSGAFPRNLSGFEKNDEHEHPRSDWLWWARQDARQRPIFGDYTVQYPLYEEPPVRANFSASIRYTSDDYWVIMRGEGVFNDDGPGFAQFPANAQLLSDRSEFCGPDYSFGDKYIFEMGQQSERTGTAEHWIRAGINHHMTFTANQISNSLAGSTDS